MRDFLIELRVRFEFLLNWMFPPKFDAVRDWNTERGGLTDDGTNLWVNGGKLKLMDMSTVTCGDPQPKKFRDGIDRHFRENAGV